MMNVSFAGCGFMGIYHIGVASCFKTYAPHLLLDKVSGASAGSIAAVSLLADLDMGETTSDIIRVALEARSRALGPFSPSFNINDVLYEGLNKLLPENIHEKVNGRLHISLTRVYDGKNMLVNQFSSKEEVIQVVLASCFIPVFSGWLPPRYRGVRVIDGGFSDNLPNPDSKTITVCPFAGNSDICPQDDAWNVFRMDMANHAIDLSVENLFRMGKVLLPPEPEVLAKMCKQGFDDTLRFLQNKFMISCTRCLTLQSTYHELDQNEPLPALDKDGGCREYDPDCLDCKLQRDVAEGASVTDNSQLWQAFENAMAQAEAELSNWYLISLSTKFIKTFSKPVTLPLNLAYKFITRLTALTGIVGPDVKLMKTINTLIDQLYLYVSSGGYYITGNMSHTAKYTCEFSIQQFGEDENDEYLGSDDSNMEPIKDLLNVEVTAHLQTNETHILPHNQVEAMKFQTDNLEAAVDTRCHSRVISRVVSRAGSRIASRRVSIMLSRMGSRTNSMNNIASLDGESSDTIEQIRNVTEANEPVMSFFYLDSGNQVKVTKIFDVTKMDPSILAQDNLGIDYDTEQTSATPNFNTRRGSQANFFAGRVSEGRTRHKSANGIDHEVKQQRNLGATSLIRVLSSQQMADFRFGEQDDPDRDDSDPESDWKSNSPHSPITLRRPLSKAVSFANITTL